MTEQLTNSIRWKQWILERFSLVLLAVMLGVFGVIEPGFLALESLFNIVVQSSVTMIVATGIAFVLISGGIDLSVGSVMYASAAIGGSYLLSVELSKGALGLSIAIMIGIGVLFGIINSILITQLRVLTFITTLGMLYVGRGLGHVVTETRAMNLPETFLEIGSARFLGIPLPILIAAGVTCSAHFILRNTAFGRQVHAIGYNQEAARVAGIKVQRRIFAVFVICSLFAAIGGVVALSQLGTVSPNLGFNREFTAISAAVLGGVSLFGGRGRVIPGVVVGAIFLQTIESGLVVLNVDPYYFPIVNGGILFLAVLLDALRTRWTGSE